MNLRTMSMAGAAAVLAGAVPGYGQGTTLGYKWIRGEQIVYRQGQQNVTTMSGPGLEEVTMRNSSAQVFRLWVEDVAADGSATLRHTVESQRVEVTTPTETIVVDSAAAAMPTDPGQAAMALAMSAIVGEPITIVVRPTGSVIRVEGMERIIDKVAKAVPPDARGTQMLSEFKASMNDDAMRGMFEQNFAVLPANPVRIGETWSAQIRTQNPMLGSMLSAISSTLTGIESSGAQSIAHIAVTRTTHPEAESGGPTSNVRESEVAGETLFDVTLGRLQRTTLTSESPLTSARPGGQAGPRPATRNTTTLEIVRN